MQHKEFPAKAAALAVALLFFGVLFSVGLVGADSNGPQPQPADKVAVAGSTIEFLHAILTEGASSEEVSLFSTSIKTSGTSSLILHLTAECALWTTLTTIGNDGSEAVAGVKVWIELNGDPVAVTSSEDDEELGKVVFCNRAHRQTTGMFENENATIEQFQRTRSANAFNWIALTPGAGTHDIEVKARLDVEVTNLGEAMAGVGKRTLVVEPVKLPPGTSI